MEHLPEVCCYRPCHASPRLPYSWSVLPGMAPWAMVLAAISSGVPDALLVYELGAWPPRPVGASSSNSLLFLPKETSALPTASAEMVTTSAFPASLTRPSS